MIFLHIVDDYYLQGCLANLKQKSWWEKNAPDGLYEYDYIIALIEHGFSWTFTMMLPIAIYMFANNKFNDITWISSYIAFFILNWFLHSYIDNLKANEKRINLIFDQCFHIWQIICTWLTIFFL